MVMKLRVTRQKFQDLETEYSEKKAAYENIRMAFESERTDLNRETENIDEELARQESLYHSLNNQIQLIEIQLKRVTDEVMFKNGQGKYSDEYKTNQDMLSAMTNKLEAVNKELRMKQRHIKDNHEPLLNQITMFQHLKKLLECKIQIHKREQVTE